MPTTRHCTLNLALKKQKLDTDYTSYMTENDLQTDILASQGKAKMNQIAQTMQFRQKIYGTTERLKSRPTQSNEGASPSADLVMMTPDQQTMEEADISLTEEEQEMCINQPERSVLVKQAVEENLHRLTKESFDGNVMGTVYRSPWEQKYLVHEVRRLEGQIFDVTFTIPEMVDVSGSDSVAGEAESSVGTLHRPGTTVWCNLSSKVNSQGQACYLFRMQLQPEREAGASELRKIRKAADTFFKNLCDPTRVSMHPLTTINSTEVSEALKMMYGSNVSLEKPLGEIDPSINPPTAITDPLTRSLSEQASWKFMPRIRADTEWRGWRLDPEKPTGVPIKMSFKDMEFCISSSS